jgi:hypothetical protein
VLHEQVVDSSEHQIRLSKGVTAKFVQTKELGSCHPGRRGLPGSLGCRLPANEKATAMVACWNSGCGCFVSLFLE